MYKQIPHMLAEPQEAVTGHIDFPAYPHILILMSDYTFCRMKNSQQLVSHDIHSNKYQYKHTFSVEISPISKVS